MKSFLPLHCLREVGMDRDKSVKSETVSEEKRTEPKQHKPEVRQLKGTNKKGQKAHKKPGRLESSREQD